MTDFKISSRAYAKMILHAARYPHKALNGFLLTDKESSGKNKNVNIIDVIPGFHQCLFVSPMQEVALMMIDGMCDENNLAIAGYYIAPESFDHDTIEKIPSILTRVADKIADNCPNSCLLMIENKFVCLDQVKPALKAWKSVESRWVKAEYTLENSKSTLEAVSSMLKKNVQETIIDFDNHLDDGKLDWTNPTLNKDLEKIMAMY